MSEADRLWKAAMKEAAEHLIDVANFNADGAYRPYLMAAIELQGLPRPAGWGEGGEDE